MYFLLINAFQSFLYSAIGLNLIAGSLASRIPPIWAAQMEFRHFCSSATVTVRSCKHSEVQLQKPPSMDGGTILHLSLMTVILLNALFNNLSDFHGNQMQNSEKNP